ncbi:MAG: hypothetical protein QOF18_2719 [Frankiaceae bacterium]|nr:hypothetical protein [Frankiaceae bacterium]
MARRIVVSLAALGASLAPLGMQVGQAAPATPNGVDCVISGTAHLSPGVTTKAQAVTYTFTGSLTNCKDNTLKIKSGTVTASGSSGNLTCAKGNTVGTGSVTWNTGQVTNVSFTTTGAGSALVVKGTVTSGLWAGGTVTGALNFITAAATDCTKGGLSTLPFKGDIGTGIL